MDPKDRPSKDVIENDKVLDDWYETHMREIGKRSGAPGDARYAILGPGSSGNEPVMPEFSGA